MAIIQIKSEKLSPFGGIFSIMEQFDSTLSSVIDSDLGLRCKSFGYQYSEIIRSLMSIYFCGGSCIEDVTTHLMPAINPGKDSLIALRISVIGTGSITSVASGPKRLILFSLN